jgi:hypothetical protein
MATQQTEAHQPRRASERAPPFPPCSAKKPHLQGRFSGRLATKDDERRLAEECRLLGPLLGGVGKRGDSSRQTLAKIVRGIASGHVREYLETRERRLKVGLTHGVTHRLVSGVACRLMRERLTGGPQRKWAVLQV